jgi:nucleotide-binding universal stress UspA family protein
MKTLSHILVATDFSEPSLIAVNRAGQLARQHGAELTVFHGLDVSQLGLLPRGFDALTGDAGTNIKQESLERLQKLAESVKAQGVPKVNALLVDGNAQKAISLALNTSKADLLVVGGHGEGFWHELFLGSYISSLLAHSTVPVLVSKQASPVEYKNILIPVDFSKASDSLIQTAKTIAPKAKKTLLHIPVAPLEGMMRLKRASADEISTYKKLCTDEAQTKLSTLLESANDPSFSAQIVGHNYAPSEIISYQMDNLCDLVLIGKHGTGFVSDLLIGSVSKLVISNVSCDTLVVNASQQENL